VGSKRLTVIVDSDAFLALLYKADDHAATAERILHALIECKTRFLYPASVITETATLVQRRLKLPEIAQQIAHMVKTQRLMVTPVDQETLTGALTYYRPTESSSHHTLFDAVVAATAKAQQADAIFSFDGWYQSLGFTLAGALVAQGA
jgi:predicted nucleic acid-binding protein